MPDAEPPSPASEAERPPEEELLIDGQEEVFSRTEVERGMIEHHVLEEDQPPPPPPERP